MKALARVANVVFVAVSPAIFYVAVTRLRVGQAALVVAGWITLRSLPALLTIVTRDQIVAALKLPLIAIVVSLLGAITNDRRLLLLLPSLTQLGFAWVFGSSLGGKVPLVEHFARMQKPELSVEEVRYCRTVTWVWAIYLTACAIAGLVLAWVSTPAVWAAYTGVGAYLLVGALFSAEYVFRKIRFRGMDGSALDRALVRWLPPRIPPSSLP